MCMNIPVVSLAAASGAGEEPRREGEGMGETVLEIRCCRYQRGREEHVAASGVAGRSVLCLSVKLINKMVLAASSEITNLASTEVRLGFLMCLCISF